MTEKMATQAERLARAALCVVAQPGDALLGAIIARLGAVGAIEAALRGRTPTDLAADLSTGPAADSVADEDTRLANRLEGWGVRLAAADAAADLARFENEGGRLACPGDKEWPAQLDDLGHKAPYALWLQGPNDLRDSCQSAVAVVGARAATSYGVCAATDLAAELSTCGWTVVSGAAMGIDAAAHRGALAAEGNTVAVLANGVDVPHPSCNEDLYAVMGRRALLVSESPPGADPTRARVLARHRLLAALTCGTVVVEAAAHSGALTVARSARDLGRVVMAVPGPVTSRTSVGCHSLLRQSPPARCVTSAAQVIEDLEGARQVSRA